MPPLCTSLMIIALLNGVPLDSASAAAIIDVHATARISSGVIRLIDVADIDDGDPETQRRLETITLGPVPPPGRKTRLTQQTIRQRLLACGVNLAQIEFTGQSMVIVETASEDAPAVVPASVEIPAAQTAAARPLLISEMQRNKAEKMVQDAFHRQYHTTGGDVGPMHLTVEFSDDNVHQILDLKPHDIRFSEPGLKWGGPQTLTIKIPEQDGSSRIIRMEAWLKQKQQILTVKHTVPKGQVIGEDDLTLVPAKEGESGLQVSRGVIGQEAARDLAPGQPLQSRDLHKVPLVRSSDLVTVRFRSPGLTVSRVFRASGNGALGDVVNFVALEDPREKMQATVTGWHEAEVDGRITEESAQAARPPMNRRYSATFAGRAR